MKAGSWTASAQVVVAVTQLVATIPLARLLGPYAFGVFAFSLFAFSACAFLADLGVTNGIIAREDVRDDQLAVLHTLAVLVASGFAAILVVSASLFAHFAQEQDQDEVLQLTRLSAICIVLLGFQSVPRAIVVRAGRFRALAVVEVCAVILSYVVALTIAFLVHDERALLGQLFAHTLFRAIGFSAIARWGLVLPRFDSLVIRRQLGWAAGLYAYNNASFLARNVDNLLVGRGLGTEALGLYSRAFALLLAPITHISLALTYVAVDNFAQKREDLQALRAAYINATQIMACFAAPFAMGLAVLAEPVVLALYGPAWVAAVPLVRGFAVAAGFQLTACTSFWLLQARESRGRLTAVGLLNAVPLLAVALGILTKDLRILALAYGVLGGPVLYMLVLLVGGTATGVSALDMLRANVRAVLTGLVFAASLGVGVVAIPGQGLSDLGSLLLGVPAYLVSVLLIRPEGVLSVAASLRRRAIG